MKLKLLLSLLFWTMLWLLGAGIVLGSLQLFKDRHIIEGVESLLYLVVTLIAIYFCFLNSIIINDTIRKLYEEFTKK